jgi:hypothetical protein
VAVNSITDTTGVTVMGYRASLAAAALAATLILPVELRADERVTVDVGLDRLATPAVVRQVVRFSRHDELRRAWRHDARHGGKARVRSWKRIHRTHRGHRQHRFEKRRHDRRRHAERLERRHDRSHVRVERELAWTGPNHAPAHRFPYRHRLHPDFAPRQPFVGRMGRRGWW